VQLALCQAVDLRGPGQCARRSAEVHKSIRAAVPINDADRRQDRDIESVLKLYRSGALPIGSADFPAE
jgi:histidine ammonia-lyase